MVYMNKDKNNNVVSFIVTCSCGCGDAFEFKTLDGDVYISALTGEFYNRQGILNSTRKQIKDIFYKITNKDSYWCDCCMDKQDIIDFLYAINHFTVEENDEGASTFSNDGYLTLWSDDVMDSGDSIYGMAIRPKVSIWQYLAHKNFRAYELVYNYKTWKHFVNICNKKFSNI